MMNNNKILLYNDLVAFIEKRNNKIFKIIIAKEYQNKKWNFKNYIPELKPENSYNILCEIIFNDNKMQNKFCKLDKITKNRILKLLEKKLNIDLIK